MPPRKDAGVTKVQQNSLGGDALVRKWNHKYGKSQLEREVTRQFLYLDEEGDFNADNHEVGQAEKRRIQRGDLTDANDFHVDQAEELGDEEGETLPPEAPEAIAQFEADVLDKTRSAKFKAKTRVGSQQTVNAIRRATMARGVGINEERLRESLTQTAVPAYKRLAAAQTLAQIERDRRTLAAMPELPNETPAVRDARAQAQAEQRATAAAGKALPQENDTQAVSIAELQRMLTLDPFPSLNRTIQTGLLDIPDLRSVTDYLQPKLFEREHDKKHENGLEVIMNMRAAGAHWEEIIRIAVPTRLALALDPVHYSDYIVRGEESAHDAVMIGGHEHYDEVHKQTTLIVMKFWTVRKSKSNNSNKIVQKAKRLLGGGVDVGEDVERDRQGTDTNARPRTFDGEDDDEVDKYDDTDDYYDGGSDVKNPRNHFMCCVRVVFVEARECLHKDDTGHIKMTLEAENTMPQDLVAPPPDEFEKLLDDPNAAKNATPAAAEPDQEFAYADPELEEERKANETAAPGGTMVVTQQVATQLAGKYRFRKLMGWFNGPKRPAGDGSLGDSRQLGPLCFRAYNISSE